MRRLVAKLAPRSLTAQLMWLLAAALVAANLAAILLLGSERREAVREARRLVELQRVAALVPGLALLDPVERARIVRASSRRALRLRLARRPITAGRARDADLERRFETEVGEPVDVRIARPDPGRGGPRRAELLASIRLPDGQWLNARLRRAPAVVPRGGIGFLVLAMGLSLLFVLGVAFLFLRRITGPIRALTAAARRAGQGDRTATVHPAGSAETRAAATAFNEMQAAIARFEAERARTVAAVGHDLRTPITSLRIRAEMLDRETAAPMIRTLDEMRVMADDLLTWGRDEAEPEGPIDLTAMLAEICAEHDAATLVEAAPVVLRGRPVALRRAFANLVDNAVRYGARAGVRVVPGRVTIEDDGPGIPDEEIAAMLEPFTRGEASRASHTGGAGLGLSIARRILRAHGFALLLANRPEGGLRVSVTLPQTR